MKKHKKEDHAHVHEHVHAPAPAPAAEQKHDERIVLSAVEYKKKIQALTTSDLVEAFRKKYRRAEH